MVKPTQFLDANGGVRTLPADRQPVPRTSAYGVCIVGGKLLLSKPTWSDRWELPGGKVEEREELVSALQREVEEETGYGVPDQPLRSLGEYRENFYIESEDQYYDSRLVFFLIERVGDQKRELVHWDEVSEVEWVPLAEIKESNVQRNTWWGLHRALRA